MLLGVFGGLNAKSTKRQKVYEGKNISGVYEGLKFKLNASDGV